MALLRSSRVVSRGKISAAERPEVLALGSLVAQVRLTASDILRGGANPEPSGGRMTYVLI